MRSAGQIHWNLRGGTGSVIAKGTPNARIGVPLKGIVGARSPACTAAAAFASPARGTVGVLVEGDPGGATVIVVQQEIRGADRLHLLAGARHGGAHAEELHESLVVHVLGQDNARGFHQCLLLGDLLGADGQGHRIHDRGGHAGAEGHGQEGVVDAVTVGQAEGDVRGAAGGVDAQFLAQAAHEGEDLMACRRHGADGHDQRINHDVMGGNAEVCRALDNLLGHGETDVGVFRDTGIVVGDRHYGHVVLGHQRQDELQPLLLPGDGVQERATLGRG
mmetsp:Transcript_3632/g.6670  ORF Transcript_3632/g.6670 Transcript_3632/m.6670 type:complete len:276 (-) Transcript_3632:1073-1900(-)